MKLGSSLIVSMLWLCAIGDAMQEPSGVSRRNMFLQGGTALTSTWFLPPIPSANAARGAAELDLEFYMRDLMGGNKKEGTIQASRSPSLPPPRVLQGPLLPFLLDDDCSINCIPTQALVQQIKTRNGEGSDSSIARDIQERVTSYRSKASRSFYARAPWTKEAVTDQYYFDFTAYAFWRAAADLLPDYIERDKFVRDIGRRIYGQLQSAGLVGTVPAGGRDLLVGSIPVTMQILNLFQSSNYCKGFRIRGEDTDEDNDFVFDELDDESLLAGGSANCLVSVFEPSTLGASLQINGEQSRFGPNYVATTLAAVWEAAGIRSSWETFFVDPEYRPNPKDYFPNEQLIQFTLTKQKARAIQ